MTGTFQNAWLQLKLLDVCVTTTGGGIAQNGTDSLAAGERPPLPPDDPLALGEWTHGWQFHASDNSEKTTFRNLVQTRGGGPGARVNAATVGKTRLRSCMGAYAATWLTICPTTASLTLKNTQMACAIRRRLGIGVLFDGGDSHGHSLVTTNQQGRLNSRHTTVLVAWRQVLTEAGGLIPDRNVERLIRDTHIPVPAGDTRRLDLIVPGLNVANGLPLFCDITVVCPIRGDGNPRPGTSNRGGTALRDAERANDNTY